MKIVVFWYLYFDSLLGGLFFSFVLALRYGVIFEGGVVCKVFGGFYKFLEFSVGFKVRGKLFLWESGYFRFLELGEDFGFELFRLKVCNFE